MTLAVAIGGRLFDAEQVVAGHLGEEALEDVVPGPDDAEQRAAAEPRELLQSLLPRPPVVVDRRGQQALGGIEAGRVQHQHADRGARDTGQRGDVVDEAGILDDEAFGHDDQRLLAVKDRELPQQVPQRAEEAVGAFALGLHHLEGLVLDLALAPLDDQGGGALGGALAKDDLPQAALIHAVDDGVGLGHADVELALELGPGAGHGAHRLADPGQVVGEVHRGARLGDGQKRDAVERTQSIQESGRGRQDGSRGAEADVALVDHQEDLAATGGADVGRELRLHRLCGRAARVLRVDPEVLRRHDPSRLTVDLDSELRCAQVGDRPAAVVEDGDVHGEHLDAGAEGRALCGLRRLRGYARDGDAPDSKRQDSEHASHQRQLPIGLCGNPTTIPENGVGSRGDALSGTVGVVGDVHRAIAERGAGYGFRLVERAPEPSRAPRSRSAQLWRWAGRGAGHAGSRSRRRACPRASGWRSR